MEVLEIPVGAVFAPTRFPLARISIRDHSLQTELLTKESKGLLMVVSKRWFEFSGGTKFRYPLLSTSIEPPFYLNFTPFEPLFYLFIATPPTWQRNQNPPRLEKSKKSLRESLWGSLRGTWPSPQNESKTSLLSQKTGDF